MPPPMPLEPEDLPAELKPPMPPKLPPPPNLELAEESVLPKERLPNIPEFVFHWARAAGCATARLQATTASVARKMRMVCCSVWMLPLFYIVREPPYKLKMIPNPRQYP